MSRKLSAIAVAVLMVLPAALLCAAEPPKGDKDLDGDWEIVSVTHDGKQEPPQDAKPVLTIKGDTITFKVKDESHTGTIKVDASKTPKTIDLTPDDGPEKGKTILGIYELKGDELRICHGEAGKDRPTEVSSKEGSGLSLAVLKRVKK
jgi:uncharacterized protein (TIGR03067 family)